MSSALTRPDADASRSVLGLSAGLVVARLRQRAGQLHLVVQVLAERHARIGRLEQERRRRAPRRCAGAIDVAAGRTARSAAPPAPSRPLPRCPLPIRCPSPRHRPAVPRLEAAGDGRRRLGHVGHRRRLTRGRRRRWSRRDVGHVVAAVVGSGGRCAGWLGGVCCVGGVCGRGCCAARPDRKSRRRYTRRGCASSWFLVRTAVSVGRGRRVGLRSKELTRGPQLRSRADRRTNSWSYELGRGRRARTARAARAAPAVAGLPTP